MKVRLLGLLSALALFFVAAVPAAADDPGEGNTYLALGDSVTFGFSPLLNRSNASNFIGYPAIVGERLQMSVTNPACSGEATGSFISMTGLDNACRPYRAFFPLHVNYAGTQLAFAVNFLKNNPNTSLVTFMLDANDFFRVSEGTPGPAPWPPSGCYTPDLVTYFATCAVQNITTIFKAIRGTGYQGLLVVLTYYALDYTSIPGLLVTQGLLNKAMLTAGAPFGITVADGFGAFQQAAAPFGGSSCKAGLLIVLSTSPLTCDVHPTPKGRDLLAGAVVRAVQDAQS
ncbi:MAG TPA: SGNH/GDSL hydrolase family protein [Candidatus Dormibacteraeota bacterium]|nr:SGNH/GDSL hydrolase family protein [Candidatus Dormibacteraeota bacterium]HEX2680426.1 SGNH/GDSL hydrolase family protein [Candidatus Dormibacteraeota bacterium]